MPGRSKYQSFRALEKNEKKGVDYRIRWREGTPGIAIMAIHGGGIEPGTTEIAEAIAGSRHSFYTFSGLKKTENAVLHITSRRFDETIGRSIAKKAATIITIHGCRENGSMVYIGGRNSELKENMVSSLHKAGFQIAQSSQFPGLSSMNICNRCRLKAGVQLELCHGLRARMFEGLKRNQRDKTTAIFWQFVNSLKQAIVDYK